MYPIKVPEIETYEGDTLHFPTYTFKTDGVPVDLSQWQWRAQWRRYNDDEAFVELSVDSSEAANGIINIKASATASKDIQYSGVWDLQGTNGNEVRTWLAGKTRHTKDVTRAS